MRKCCLPFSGACLGETRSEKLYDAQNSDEKRGRKICDSFHVASACEGIFSSLYSILRKEKLLVSQTIFLYSEQIHDSNFYSKSWDGNFISKSLLPLHVIRLKKAKKRAFPSLLINDNPLIQNTPTAAAAWVLRAMRRYDELLLPHYFGVMWAFAKLPEWDQQQRKLLVLWRL